MNNRFSREKCKQIIKKAIIEIWEENIRDDYDNHRLLKEDTLKNSFYYHLRTKLGDSFLVENNLAIFTEFFVAGKRIDLAVVEIDTLRAKFNHLDECVNGILAVVEMKYKGSTVQNNIFQNDVDKIMNFLSVIENEPLFYLAFIREIRLEEVEIENWLMKEQQILAKNRVTELLAYHSIGQGKMIWTIIEH